MSESPPWEDIRRTVEAGVPMGDASKKYGVKYDTLKKRAQRERWLTDSRIKSAIEARKSKKTGTGIVPHPSPESVISDSLEGMGTELRQSALAIARSALMSLAKTGTLPIESWQDAKLATEIGLKAAGLDSSNAPPVQILITDAPARILDA